MSADTVRDLIVRLFTPVKRTELRAPVSTHQNMAAAEGRELVEPEEIMPFQIMLRDAVREGVKECRSPVEILCGETVSYEELREFITRKRRQAKPVTNPTVDRFIAINGIQPVGPRLYSMGQVVRACQEPTHHR